MHRLKTISEETRERAREETILKSKNNTEKVITGKVNESYDFKKVNPPNSRWNWHESGNCMI